MDSQDYDLIVVGGGPAGMMAAGRCAELGGKVLLIEKNRKLGEKLLITGGGRCNITNAEFDIRKMVSKYGPKGKALFGSFTRFGVKETFDFFESRGLGLKVEAEKRAFPKSDKAEDVWKILADYTKEGRVEVLRGQKVTGLMHDQSQILGVKVGKKVLRARNYLIATGGKSRPETGSTGDGFKWLKKAGHEVEEPNSALVPIKIREDWPKQNSGLSFKNTKLTVFQDGQKQESRTGKLLLTHFGISGPLALNMSKGIAELHKYGEVRLELDLYPDLDLQGLDQKVLQVVGNSLNKQLKNNLGELIPPRMIENVLKISGIDPEIRGNALTKNQRLSLVKTIKGLPMTVSGFLGTEKAIVTSGGVSLKEVDFKNMRSKIFTNLYLAGDILNFDRPSGGFSLQICWTTGYLAGEAAAG